NSVQQECGGWGETCGSYDDPSLAGQGTPTASQTAWALLALLAAGHADSDSVRAAVAYLQATPPAGAGRAEAPFTGPGFAKVFYLMSPLCSLSFPLMALARYDGALRNGVASPRFNGYTAPDVFSPGGAAGCSQGR